MERDRLDGSIAHRGDLPRADDRRPRPYASPRDEIVDGLGDFGRATVDAPAWRRQMGRVLLALFALGLLMPFVVMLPYLFD